MATPDDTPPRDGGIPNLSDGARRRLLAAVRKAGVDTAGKWLADAATEAITRLLEANAALLAACRSAQFYIVADVEVEEDEGEVRAARRLARELDAAIKKAKGE